MERQEKGSKLHTGSFIASFLARNNASIQRQHSGIVETPKKYSQTDKNLSAATHQADHTFPIAREKLTAVSAARQEFTNDTKNNSLFVSDNYLFNSPLTIRRNFLLIIPESLKTKHASRRLVVKMRFHEFYEYHDCYRTNTQVKIERISSNPVSIQAPTF